VAFAPSAAVAATRPTTASVISTATDSKLGAILVSGNTLYALKASKTACTATCLKAWLPVLLPKGVTTATAGGGVDASKLGTAPAAKGALQVTYAGKRLYWFVKDKAPGQVHGNVKNKWGKWSAVVVSDTSATTTTPAPTTAVPSSPPPAAAQTSPPETAAPETAPPQTSPPATSPPATSPPATKPPVTSPPSNGGNGGVGF
jgi:predicted lipoprotein with Yx(FWY)xxD motif